MSELWEPPTEPAASVEEAAQRFVDAAKIVKPRLGLKRDPTEGVWQSLLARKADEMALWALDVGHQVVTGKPLPEELRPPSPAELMKQRRERA